MTTLARYFKGNGRIGRATWLAKLCIAALLATAFGSLVAAVGGERFAVIVAAAFTWSAIAISAQRLHDIDKSAWSLLVAVVPIAGPLWVLFQLTRAGVEGRNRFGGDPEARLDYLRVDIGR